MIKNILKKLILVLLMLFSLLMQAQDPVTNIDLNTDESGSTKNYIAREYIKLIPGFQYKPEGASQEYNPLFENEIINLYDHFQDENIHETNTPKEMGQDAIDYINVKYPNDATDFIDFIIYSFDYDPSIPVYVPVAPKSFTAKIDESMIFYADYNQAEMPFSTSLHVGTINGMASVSPTGGATYQIPIKLPPGTAGMMPNLGIVYNSQSPGGILGVGWTISGFSAITRIPTNLHNDGFIDGVNFNANDKFALDGNRLVNIGTGLYGANNTEYRTQMETFSKIYSYGTAGAGPEKFIIETKDGKMLEYGYASDSRFIADGQSDVLIWLLNKVTDQNGNYYTIHYHIENKEYWPKEIKYTANDSASLQAYNSIKFFYDEKDKKDHTYAYFKNSEVQSTVILRKLAIYQDENLVRKYELKYKKEYINKGNTALDHQKYLTYDISKSSHLSEIIEYYGSEEKLNSTKISWENSNPFIEDQITNITNLGNFYPGDYNGDGKTDLFVAVYERDGNGNIVYDPAPPYFAFSEWRLYTTNDDGKSFTLQSSDIIDHFAEFWPGDFNGDGLTDILHHDSYGFIVFISRENNFEKMHLRGYNPYNPSIGKVGIGDFDGDTQMDWMITTGSTTDNVIIDTYDKNDDGLRPNNVRRIALRTISSINKHIIADFNGNGKSDIMFISETFDDNSNNIYEYSDENGQFNSYFNTGFPTKDHDIFPGDFNGDGKADVLTYVSSVGWEINYFGGNGFIPDTRSIPLSPEGPEYYGGADGWGSFNTLTQNNYLISDFNGDGKADIIEQNVIMNNGVPENTEFMFLYIKGKDTPYEGGLVKFEGLFSYRFRLASFVDFNGDGKSDILTGTDNYPNNQKIINFHPNEKTNLVNSVTNGLNLTSTFNYKTLTYGTEIYSKGIDDTNQDVNVLQPPLNVVASLVVPSGVYNRTKATEFLYEGLKLHKRGKGLLGFNKVTTTEINIGGGDILKEDVYNYNSTYYNTFLEKSTISVSSGSLISTTNLNYQVQNPDDDIRRFFSFVKEKSINDNLNGFTITTNYTFDDCGNLTVQDVDHDGEGTTYTTNTYQTVNGWCDSELDVSTTEKTRTGVTGTYSRTIDHNYTNGHLSQTITDESSTLLKVTTDYLTYNPFGLLEKFTVTGNGKIKTTNLKYDSKGRAQIEKTFEGPDNIDFVTKKTYDFKTGNLLTETDALDLTTIYNYDAFGNLSQIIYPSGNKINYSKEWVTKAINSSVVIFNTKEESDDGSIIKKYYSKTGKVLREETLGFNGEVIFKDYSYYETGKINSDFDPYFESGRSGNYSQYVYESNGRIDFIESRTGMVYYDYSQKQVTITNQAGQSTTKTINAYGDVVEVADNGGTITYGYNSAGLPETITTTGSSSISLDYDLHGNRTSIIDPNAGTVSTTYDAFGNLLTQSDANGSYTMEYDNLGRITTKTGTDGVTDYTYFTTGGGLGQIKSINYNHIDQTFTYDSYGRLLSTTENIDNKDYSYAYTYDEFGRESSITYPSGFGITNIYNSFGYLSQISQTGGNIIWQADNMNALGQ